MKKAFIVSISVIMSVVLLFVLVWFLFQPKSYKGTEVAKITYRSIDYFGGHTQDYLFDFTSNTASKRAYMPSFDMKNDIPEYEQFADFTEADAKVFLDKCYAGGLFSLKKSYETKEIIMDGGGWSLTIEYVDGTTFSSKGDNAGPTNVFDKCKFAFYELCGEGIVGSIPSSYLYPPDISLTFEYQMGNKHGSDNSLARIRRGNYLWNGHSASETSYYEVNQELSEFNKFDGTCQYILMLYTSNFQHEDIYQFYKFTLTCYDYNEEMSNERVLLSSEWFHRETVPLQFDKIYIYKLYWPNGDFAEYTFNTKTS